VTALKGFEGEPSDHQLQVNAVIGQLQKVDLFKISGELADHVRRIFRTNLERDDRPSISQNSVTDFRLKLAQVLMGYGKPVRQTFSDATSLFAPEGGRPIAAKRKNPNSQNSKFQNRKSQKPKS
jgi:hypothetical protein